MFKLILVFFSVLPLLIACEQESSAPVKQRLEKQTQKHEPLDLRLTPEMMEKLEGMNEQDMSSEEPVKESNMLDLKETTTESRIKLKGEIYFDETSEEYIKSIEGGKLDVEIKFND